MLSAIKLSSPPSTSNLVSFSQVKKLGKQQQQMAKQGEISSWPIKFFRVILTTMLESGGELELPIPFVKTQGKNLCKYACLKIPTGEETKMELKMSEGRAWLHKGWQEFVDKYSIQSGYFLNFQYHGDGSNFDVIIFDMSCTEIKYPVISPSTRDQHAEKFISIEVSADDSDDEISDESPQKVQKGKGIMENAKKSRKLEIANARETVLEKANSFKSPYPHFIITMTPTYVSGTSYLYVPIGPAKRCFSSKGKRKTLFHLNGDTWPMEYTVEASSCAVKIYTGWNEFAKGNNLKARDVCVFELVKRKPLEFNITIFRNADEEVVVTKTSAKKETRRPKVLKRVESSKSEIPHFRITIAPTYIRRAIVPVPAEYAKIYLKEDVLGENVIKLHGLNGRSWEVAYCHRPRRPHSNSKKVLLTKGWLDFVRDNCLQEGDTINFKRMSGKAKAYKFTIIRLGDHA